MKPEPIITTPATTTKPTARRSFLLGATLASAGAVAAVVAGGNTTEIVGALGVESKPAKPKGYHVTPHISQYYETTKL